MRRRFIALVLSFLFVSGASTGVGYAQTDSVPPNPPSLSAATIEERDLDVVLVQGASEWSAGLGFGIGVGRRLSGDNSVYGFQTLSWGRVLTPPSGPEMVRGRFEWAVEVIPIFGQFQPQRTWGVGIAPLVWRWNFERQGPMAPFAEVGGGGLWTGSALPEGTVSGNFTAHVTLGVRRLLGARRGYVLAYRYDHISNGNRADRNPGINAHVAYFAWTFLRPAK